MTVYSVPKPVRVKREAKRKIVVEANPLECCEQQVVAEWLDAHKVFYTATMAGSYLHPATYNRVKKLGVKKGVSDLLIFDPPPAYHYQDQDRNYLPTYVGVCLEMKRKKGGQVSYEQKEWLEKMVKRGWLIHVSLGATDAIEFLELCGYGSKNILTK